MGKRQREWAHKKHRALIVELGGKCVVCGTTGDDENDLQVDHVDGRDYDIGTMDQSWRICVYWQEFRAGVRLQVLCKSCNSSKGKPNGNIPGQAERNPTYPRTRGGDPAPAPEAPQEVGTEGAREEPAVERVVPEGVREAGQPRPAGEVLRLRSGDDGTGALNHGGCGCIFEE